MANSPLVDSDQDSMAFLSGFVKSGLSLLGKDASSFPYTIGQKVEWFEGQSIWSLHRGVKKVRHIMIASSVIASNIPGLTVAKSSYRRITLKFRFLRLT